MDDLRNTLLGYEKYTVDFILQKIILLKFQIHGERADGALKKNVASAYCTIIYANSF